MRLDTHATSDIIGKIYDCSLELSRWPSVLGEICDHMDALCAEVQSYNPVTYRATLNFSYGWDEETIALVHQQVTLNPGAPLALVAPLDEPIWAESILDFEDFKKSHYYRLALSKVGHRDYIHVPLVRNVMEMTGWGVTRHVTRGSFTEEHVAFVKLLSPHIKRSLTIGKLLIESEVQSTSLDGLLASMQGAAFIVSHDLSIIFCNTLAEAELESGKFFIKERGRLKPQLSRVAEPVANLPQGSSMRGRDVEFKDDDGNLRQITLIHLPKSVGPQDQYLLLIRSPAAELVTPLGTAAQLFKLTLSESQLLAALLQGDTLDDAAQRIGTSRSTVKTHLESIFTKSGVNRQADLIRRVLDLKTPFG